jgi:hypothetical protein
MPACSACANQIETYLKLKGIKKERDRKIDFLSVWIWPFCCCVSGDFPVGQ